MICWAGLSAPLTSSERARSFTAADELLDHRQGDVGLEQRDADLARGGVDVGLGELALAPQVLEGVGKAVGESGEHGVVSPRDRSRVSYDGWARAVPRDSSLTAYTPARGGIGRCSARRAQAAGLTPRAALRTAWAAAAARSSVGRTPPTSWT